MGCEAIHMLLPARPTYPACFETPALCSCKCLRDRPYTLCRAPSCPEIVLKSATFLQVMTHDYIYVADVECQVMFSLVTLYCFMSNIALVTFLGLQY